MKKIISILLICSMLFALLTGCSYFDKTNDGGDETGDVGNKDNISTDDNQDEFHKNYTTVDEALICELVEYLQQMYVQYELVSKSVEKKIDEIKECDQPLHVTFDSSSSYYVCAYYNIEHDDEQLSYCCAREYTWIKYENANEITEYHNDEKILVSFQINAATSVRDISSSDSNVPRMEHFQLYICNFENGINVNPSLEFTDTFVYFGSLDESVIYHSTDWYHHTLVTLVCIFYNNQYYIPLLMGYVYPGEEEHKAYMMGMLGKYYDDLLDVTINGEYTKNGLSQVHEYYYVVIKLEDFIDTIYSLENTYYYLCISVEDFSKY